MRTRGRTPPRGLFYAISIVALAVGLWGYLRLPAISLPPASVLAEKLDSPVRVEGWTVRDRAQLRFVTQSIPPGRSIVIEPVEVATGGGRPGQPAAPQTRTITLIPQIPTRQRAIILAVGLVFFAVNLLVFAPRMRDRSVHGFYASTLLYGTAILINGAYLPTGPLWPDVVPALVWLIALALLPVLFLHIALTFPKRHPRLDRVPPLFPILWIGMAGLAIAECIALLAYGSDRSIERWVLFASLRHAAEWLVPLLVFAAIVLLFRASSRLDITRQRLQARWLQWGFAIGVLPYVFLRSLPRLFGMESPLDPEFDRLFELAIPAGFTMAVVRHRLFDIDLVVRRSVLYSTLAALLAAVYFTLTLLLGRVAGISSPGLAAAVSALGAGAAVALFAPTRRAVGHWIDRTLFKLRTDHARELRAFEASLEEVAGPQEVAESLHRLVQRALEPRRALVRMPGSQGEDGAGAGDRDLWPPEQAEALTDGLPTWTIRTIYAASESTGTPEEECADYPGWLRRRGVVLAVPVLIDSSDPGWILLGEKRSERRYIDEDLRLLRDAARAAGGAVDRILLIQRAAAEAAAARRLDELTRLKDDFLGRVAHDLRTPLTAIDWSLRNLQDGLAGPLAPRQSDYLRSIRAATDQLGRLVSNLVELTRLDSPAVEHLIEALSLREIVCDALAMLAPVAAERTVRLELRATTPLPPVRADRRCLSGAVMNLIDNAVRYSPDGETVEVSIERVAGGSQTLTVRDHGPGVAPEDRETIFERYGTGRRSPSDRRRAGLGLGLYVARCGIEASGGSIAVDDHPEGGARFVFTLQDWREVSDGDDPDRR